MKLIIENLKISWPNFVLRANLEVETGKTLALAGPSGCGKTSLLRAIAGFLPLDSGNIQLAGQDIGNLPPWKRNISYVFQESNLFPHLSVAGNVGYGPFIKGLKKNERRERIAWALSLVKMEAFWKRRSYSLSGGERQRVAIARALANKPDLLLLDEPFSSLDPPLRKELQGAFLELASSVDVPIIFVSHDRQEAARVGKNIAIMKEGEIIEIGPSAEIFSAPQTAFAAHFLGISTEKPTL